MNAKKLLFIAIVSIFPFITSCNKEIEPVDLTGDWYVDTSSVQLFISVNTNVLTQNQAAYNYLEENFNRIRLNVKQLRRVTFSGINQVAFRYSEVEIYTGTFVQDVREFVVRNDKFPNGLYGASDGTALELYYLRTDMMNILEDMLTDLDPPFSSFEDLIMNFEAGTRYLRIPTSNF